MAKGEPFRLDQLARSKFGTSFLPTLADYIKNPTLSPGFQTALDTGLKTLRSQYSATGSPSSGAAQVAGAKFTEGLANDQLGRFNENLFRAAGFQGVNPPNQGANLVPSAVGIGNNISDLLFQKGSVGAGNNASWLQTFGPFASLFPWGSIFGGGGAGVAGGAFEAGGAAATAAEGALGSGLDMALLGLPFLL